MIALPLIDAPTADAPSADGFKPTRRVRTAPGGETHDIFGTYTDDDALASAPPRNRASIDKAEEQQQKQTEQAKPAHGRYAFSIVHGFSYVDVFMSEHNLSGTTQKGNREASNPHVGTYASIRQLWMIY